MEWQPIETAPKDGTRVLVARHYQGSQGKPVTWMYVARWKEEWNDWLSGTDTIFEPTHWMPLPAPPVS